MSAAPTLPEVSTYHLQHLVSNINELLGGSQSNAGRGTVQVICAQALGTEIYIGCSNGSLLRYAFVDSLEASTDTYQLLTHQSLPSGGAINQIALAPSVKRALVLCDNQIHFFTLPNLEPVQQINPVRRVVTFAIDENQQRKSLPDHRSRQPQSPEVCLCVIKRTSISVYTLREGLIFQKEIPLPKGATLARLSNKHLCIADPETYNIINIESASLIPLIPLSQAPDVAVTPSITVISDSEFLLLSWTGSNSIGVFITGDGDPVRGTLEWKTHPVSMSCDFPYVTSVLPNGTIEVQSIETQATCQTISPRSVFVPLRLETSLTGFVVPFGDQLQKVDIISFPLLEPETPNTSAIEDGGDRGTQAVTPTQLPHDNGPSVAKGKKRSARQSKATLLAVGADAVYALAAPSLIQQADELLDSHKLKEAAALVKERQKKLSQSQVVTDLEWQTEELHYVYQRLGYTCLAETIFEDAGNHLFRGNVDPRMLIRLFSTLRGTLLSSSTSSLPAFAGLVPQIRALGTIDTIIKNYTPHLQPNTRSAPPTSELRKLLMASAREMLRGYLHKWKNKVKYGGEPVIKEVSQAIDTVLVKLLAESEDTEELYALVDSSEDIIVEEVAETLIQMGQYNALIKLHRRHGDDDKLLSVWAKLVDGEWSDDDVQDPLGQMTALLNETRNRGLVQQWGLWLVKRDMEAGLKLLMSGDSKRGAKVDDSGLLEQLERVSPEAGQQFLEYLVLQKHSIDPGLHTRLAQVCLERLLADMDQKETLGYFRDIGTVTALEYSIQDTSTPFLAYLASAATSSPRNEHIRTRCRAALLLQGSNLYDATAIRAKLTSREDVLGFEVAILDGKLENHIEALKALVHTLRDTTSADAYCALGGSPVSPKVAQLIGDQLSLQPWAALVVDRSKVRSGSRKGKGKGHGDLQQTREQLLKVLLEVYMSGGKATEGHAARLLNAQGGTMDVLDVVSLVPPEWSLNLMSSFLARSLRRTVHERCEGEILKAVCLGQNLEVRDNAYMLVRAQGAVIEEPIQGSRLSGGGSESEVEDGEKVEIIPPDSIDEKVVLDEVHVEEAIKEAGGPREGVGVVSEEVT